MKRSDLYIRVITAVLFLAITCYIGVYIYKATINTYDTTPAISYSVEDSLAAQGYIIRYETVIADPGATVLPIVNEGEKVASGQSIAVEYLSREALETASEIRALRLRIAQLKTADTNTTESVRNNTLLELSAAVQSCDLGSLDELALRIDTYIFSEGSSNESELPALQARLETLENRDIDVRSIIAPCSGIFSQVTDGFEHIDLEALSDITPTALRELFYSPSSLYGYGKLVTEFRWYYAAILSAQEAASLSSGATISVQFSSPYNAAVEMKIDSIYKREGDDCVVLFSSDRSTHEIAPLRYLRADIVIGVITGIRIPKEAIHLDDDGTTFIYLQTGVRAERVDVEIIREIGDSYLVSDDTQTGTPLRVGSTIIVKANNLYDGKIVA